MYKITIHDFNCCERRDDDFINFYIDDIDAFEKKWFILDKNTQRRECYLRSKAGEQISDFYVTNQDLNIFQEDKDAKIFHEKQFILNDVTFEASKVSGNNFKFHIDQWDCTFRWIRCDNNYVRVVSYKAIGVCTWAPILGNRLADVSCYGNHVLVNKKKYIPQYYENIPKYYEDFQQREWPNPTFEDFSENTIETICWLPNEYFRTQKELEIDYRNFQVTNRIMDLMFSDVVGEREQSC